MRFWFIFFFVLYALQSSQATKSSLIDSELISNPCKPTDDADIADSDPLVNHMFAAYKVLSQNVKKLENIFRVSVKL